MNANQIMPGDKVDIRILQQVKQDKSSEITTYISSVYDVQEDGTVILNMPTQAGKILLLPVKIRYEFIFTTSQGLFKAEGTVTERYKEKNFYLLKVGFSSALEKFQRREYYRLNCMIPVNYLILDDEIVKLNKMKEIHYAIQDHIEILKTKSSGTMVDISGGGMRFVTDESLEGAKHLLLQFRLENEKIDVLIDVVGDIIRSEKIVDNNKFFNRIQFHYKDSKCQESIIRYIFEEERILRKKEQG